MVTEGVATALAPRFVSCEGAGYSPAWKQLKVTLTSLSSRPAPLRRSVAAHAALRALSQDLVDGCAPTANAFVEHWSNAYWSIRDRAFKGSAGMPDISTFGPRGAELISHWVSNEDEPTASDESLFCLPGCAIALWVVGLAKKSGEDEKTGNSMLHLARVLLGITVPWSLEFSYRWGDAFAPVLGSWGGWVRPTIDELTADLPYSSRGLSPVEGGDCLGGNGQAFGERPLGALEILRSLQPCDPLLVFSEDEP
eukprot:TRINITY_DN43208_c0_g1_i3.p1 TRINITY_DN43208_c0_g1~~TRINITY_DN43208_c0_g1_i3.p1  ORF type:complete len:253 (+),score=23.51 TRINITY_DN43208_c0_g1_i3:215-973(+)